MDMVKRVAGYERTNRRNGVKGTTPAQTRRMTKKWFRDAKLAIANEVLGDFGPVPRPVPDPCPVCDVTDGPCVTKSGKPAKANHKGRTAA